jgi:hypothetical protein
MLLRDGYISKFFNHFLFLQIFLNTENKFKNVWNFEARFVVATANKFSTWQKIEIFIILSVYRIYSIIIVSPEQYDTNKELKRQININDVDTGMKFAVYTWFPYQSSDRCSEVKNITLLDSWVISAEGHFTKNSGLFPVKFIKGFTFCLMQAYVIEDHWDLIKNYVHNNDSNRNGGMYKKSLEYELLRVVLQEMNMTYVHVSTPEGFEATHW